MRRELIPQVFQPNGGPCLSFRPEHRDHLTEETDGPLRAASCTRRPTLEVNRVWFGHPSTMKAASSSDASTYCT